MNKKGFIRTLEAVIAIIILLSIIYIVTPSADLNIDTPNPVAQAHKVIFSEVSVNNDFRDCILNQITNTGTTNNAEGAYAGTLITSAPCLDDINDYIEINRPNGYLYLAEICEKKESCLDADLPLEKSIYADSMLLVSDNPKLLRVYFWEK